MQISFALFAAFLAASVASDIPGDVVKDPYNLCDSPLEELRSLELVELRQYEGFGRKVRLAV